MDEKTLCQMHAEANRMYMYQWCEKYRAILSASIADTAPPTYQDGYQDAWIEPCPNCGHVKGKELDNGEIK